MKLLGLAALLIGAAACNCSKRPEPAPSVAPAAAPAAVQVDPALSKNLRGVWGSSASDVWAVGSGGTILRYDGSAWRSMPSGTSINLTAVSGTGPDDVWAVGESTLIMHYDGRAWRVVEMGDEDTTLLTVLALNRSEVWVGGSIKGAGIIRRYKDGKVEETRGIPGSTGIWRSWAVTPDDVWFVGSDHQAKCYAMHRVDGGYEHKPLQAGPLRAVFGVASNDVWIGAYDSTLHHWDGAKWDKFEINSEARWLGLWGTSSSDIWAFGLNGVLHHYDGKTWTRITTSTNATIWSAWGPKADDVWFVGADGTRLHWDGKTLK